MNPELIRYARNHRYQRAEGFCERLIEAGEHLDSGDRDLIARETIELAEAAGISYEDAQSAIVNFALEKYLPKIAETV